MAQREERKAGACLREEGAVCITMGGAAGGGERCWTVTIRARTASKNETVQREEHEVRLQQELKGSPGLELSILSFLTVSEGHTGSMVNFCLPLALVLLLSCPAPAQWLSFICANPKTSPSPPSNTSASVASSDAKETTEWLSTEDTVMEKSVEGSSHSPGGSRTIHAGTLAPAKAAGGGSRGSSQFKPLKQWKCGEYQEASIKEENATFCVLLHVAKSRVSVVTAAPALIPRTDNTPSHHHHPLSGCELHRWHQGSFLDHLHVR